MAIALQECEASKQDQQMIPQERVEDASRRRLRPRGNRNGSVHGQG